MTMPALRLDAITVRFGGLTAVSNLSLRAQPGTITGLIGPNGAGKTTAFNACTGVVRTAAGHVWLGEQRLDRLSTAARAEAGLGRTFQRMELFDSLSVEENVAMGPEGMLSARRPWSQIWPGAGDRRTIAARTDRAIADCGLAGATSRRVRDLSTGQRRLVELARAMATPFTFLLLDEPSSGLDVHETELVSTLLLKFVADTGIGVLLVEHDMAMVAKVCSAVNVLDFGQLIWSGPTSEAMTSEVVRAAYLGGDVEPLDAAGVGADA